MDDMRVNKATPKVGDRVKVIAARATLEDNYLLGQYGTVVEVPADDRDEELWVEDPDTGERDFIGSTMYDVEFTDNGSEDWDVFHLFEIEVQEQ